MVSHADREQVIEVFADITCPFTHVGLKRLIEHVNALAEPRRIHVRAWPLEWVNGSGLDADAVLDKAAALAEQLGVDDFVGFDASHWPDSTVPALELAASAYQCGWSTGLAVSLDLRSAVFERGLDVADPVVLAGLADRHQVPWPAADATRRVRADYDEGRRREVAGSPHFWIGDDDYFCPSLDLGHDAAGHLTARFDPDGLAGFFERIDG